MEDKSIVNMAVLAGEIMLRSGAETYRVEDTIKHILDTAGSEDRKVKTEALVLLTGIIVTIESPGEETVTVMRRVHDRGTNMHRIVEVNEISRRYCAGELSAEETQTRLNQIRGKQYTVGIYNLATVLVPAGFAPLFGGSLREILASAAVGVVLALLMTIGKRVRISSFILNMLCSAGIAVAALLLRMCIPQLNMDTVIISGIMPLVPGVAITNAIRDTLRGDYISGGARVLEAFVTAAAIAIGAGVGIALFSSLFQGGGLQ
ncbi:MAG TPA: threonine/serine exporter family protein [Candidatus Mediterraneibacter vanvlietii]|nr:threonine/serine exporter family protein [Candidatus Mediterraneibacter vanvlietii]